MKRSVVLPLTLAFAFACAPSTETTQVMDPPTGVRAVGAGIDEAKDEDESEGDDEKPKWSVDAPPGEKKKISLDVSSGTWMSLDVSPDGQTIVFDMLGDLYTMPIAGGEAKPLTSGMSWDMQPRFSPDGRHVAFTSDRGGGDNIWVIDLERPEEPKAVTKESFRLLNSPSWSPDGEYIVARKHFTDTRSLGAGEMWLYHRGGGKGIQLTEKRNDQMDAGEPVFSPDGRYLYYSLDTSSGETFEYNKDPHASIYAIRRVDLEQGREETFVSGAGGAVRPTPSPDGKYLAFVRRVGLKTVLFVEDLESGAQWPVVDNLERDMQETWAIHGVYPTFAWTPDSASMVYWAQGKVWRVDAAGGEAKEIAFHVKHEREVGMAHRVPVDVAPAKFDVKMIRWAQTSPDGSKVVYGALGKLYVRDQKSGQVRRLTSQNDHMEYYPSWSRDGRSITYVSWDDEKLGSVRVISARGGKGKVVSKTPGHYVEPVFSPDGKTVVVRRARAGSLMSDRWSRETGLFALDLARKKDEVRISRDGWQPQFGAKPDRVYFLTSGEKGARILASSLLDGRERREHVKTDKGVQLSISPDGRWLAWVERFKVHLAPFPAANKRYDIGPKGESFPQTVVAKDAGEFVHFSGDATKLYWSLGPTLYTRELKDSFAFLEGAPEKLPEATEAGENIGFSYDRPVPTGVVALVGGRVVTMKGDEVIEEGVVVVEGNRIKAVGPKGTAVPQGAKVVDVSGKTLIPGLVDVHAHGPQGSNGILPEQNWLHLSELSFGVTTVHDPSNDTKEIFSAAELVAAGETVGPRIFSTGTILYGARGWFTADVESLDDALHHLRRMAAVGAISVKSYNQPRRDQRQQVLEAGRQTGVMVVPEGGSLFMHNMTMVADGHTGVEHAVPVSAVYQDVEQFWGNSGVGYTPTLVVAYGGIWGENYWYQHTEVFENKRLLSFVPRERVDPRARRRMHASDGDWNHIRVAAAAKQLTDAGVKVNIGAHGQREGLAAHWEMWMLAQGGMSPHEALRAATINGAYYLGLDADLGSIEAGKLADIAVISGDVLEDIRESEKVDHVMIDGRLYDAATMNEVDGEKRRPLFWELDEKARPGTMVQPHEVCDHG